jgi:hypothetical protein
VECSFEENVLAESEPDKAFLTNGGRLYDRPHLRIQLGAATTTHMDSTAYGTEASSSSFDNGIPG